MARYLKRRPNWRVTVAENFTDFDMQSLAAVEKAGFDGIITVRPRTRSAEEAIECSSLPTAMLGTGSGDCGGRKRNIVFIRGTDEEIGVLAAKHFMSLGNFRSYAFAGTVDKVAWSADRQAGFAAELRRRHREVLTLRSPFSNGSPEDIAFLAEELVSLSLPAAIFASYDNRARNILLACDAAKLNVPRQVAVIGVDNDSALCDFSYPALTSIATKPEEKGEKAAIELDRIISKKNTPPHTIFVSGGEIVERESTTPLAPSSHLVEKALRYISENARFGIKARDVVAHLGVSRTLADRRFRECGAGTIGSTIAKEKTEMAKRLLSENKMPITRITALCGFHDENYAKRLFRKHTGLSMRDWRKQVSHQNKH